MTPSETPGIKSAMGPRPTGVLPKNVNLVVIGGVVLVVVMASMFSGKKTPKVDNLKASVGPSAAQQLTAFQQALEQKRREAELARVRQEERLQTGDQRNREAAVQTFVEPAPPDPLELQKLKREAEAPFASSLAVRVVEKEEKAPLDHTSQVIYRGEDHDKKTAEAESVAKTTLSKESGRLLPAKELGPSGETFFRLYEGTTVQAVLANRLDGSFTGPVTCVVTKPVYSKDGSAVLIPVGTRFLGKASKVEVQNQTRLAIAFKRLLRPDGYSVDLEAAPGLDSAGETGVAGNVNNHHIRTVSISGAMGLLGGLALYAGQGNPYAAGVASSMGNSATSTLSHLLNSVPTITIREGHAVIVYLPTDLLLREYRP